MKITIAFYRGTKEVDALVRGAFAVNTPDGSALKYRKADAWYTVTHVRTGYAVGREIRGKGRALRLAQKLNRLLPEGDFTTEDFETEGYKAFVQRALPLIRQAREESMKTNRTAPEHLEDTLEYDATETLEAQKGRS